jgi:hypothetical protein
MTMTREGHRGPLILSSPLNGHHARRSGPARIYIDDLQRSGDRLRFASLAGEGHTGKTVHTVFTVRASNLDYSNPACS